MGTTWGPHGRDRVSPRPAGPRPAGPRPVRPQASPVLRQSGPRAVQPPDRGPLRSRELIHSAPRSPLRQTQAAKPSPAVPWHGAPPRMGHHAALAEGRSPWRAGRRPEGTTLRSGEGLCHTRAALPAREGDTAKHPESDCDSLCRHGTRTHGSDEGKQESATWGWP